MARSRRSSATKPERSCRQSRCDPRARAQGKGQKSKDMTPVILIHAFPLDSRMWQQQVDVLSGKFKVIARDLRGFGTAYAELGALQEIPIDLAADDVVKLLDEKGFAKAGLMLWDTRATPADEKERQARQQMLDRLNAEGIEVRPEDDEAPSFRPNRTHVAAAIRSARKRYHPVAEG